MEKNRNRTILAIILIMVVCSAAFMVTMMFMITGDSGGLDFSGLSGEIAQIDIKGPIYSSEDIVRQIKKYDDNSSIKGLVLRIDSPGGGVAATQEIYEQLLKFKQNDKFIVVSMGSIAASGGYYASCAGDTVLANQGTLTGSIGVILSYPVADKLMDKIGLKMQVIKSGNLKDVGNYAREATPEDKRMLQAMIDDTYDQFVSVIADSREMDIEEVKKIADGSIYTGRQALRLGLIDKLGTLEDAISVAGRMADLGDNPRVVKERPIRRSIWDVMDGVLGFNLGSIAEGAKISPSLEYMYGY